MEFYGKLLLKNARSISPRGITYYTNIFLGKIISFYVQFLFLVCELFLGGRTLGGQGFQKGSNDFPKSLMVYVYLWDKKKY